MFYKISLTVLLMLVSMTVKSLGVSVGVTPGFGVCDYTTIQEALDSGDPIIKIVNDHEFEENLIIDHSVTLWGGFETCDVFGQGPYGNTPNTVIKGSAVLGAAVVTINTDSFFNIRLENLTLRDATDTIFVTNGGHGIYVDASAGNLRLNHTSVYNNTGEDGGGIYLLGDRNIGNLVLTLEESSVFGNTATNKGGGIYCNDWGSYINIYKESWIGENTALNGGGIAAENHCQIKIDSGVDVANDPNLRGVMGNIASENGGGLYLNNSGLVQMLGNSHGTIGHGDSTFPVTVSNNSANLDGAGIYAINDSDIEITDGLISNNLASRNGGGIFLDTNSTLTMDASQTQCWQNGKCSIIANNKSGSNDFGGGMYIDGNSEATIRHTFIYENRAGYGTGVYVTEQSAAGSSFYSDGNYFYRNGSDGGTHLDNFVVRANGEVEVTMYQNTITNNDVNDNRAIIGINNGVDLKLKTTIIHNEGETVLENIGTNTVNFFCLAVHEIDSISGLLVSVLEPDFVDSINDDYHLGDNSEAIDFCFLHSGSSDRDADNDLRGYDDPNHSNGIEFLVDIGADESINSDIVFKNSFE